MNDHLIEPLQQLIEPPTVYWLAGAILLGTVFLVMVGRCRARRRGIVPFKSEGGKIEIAPDTIRNLIEHAAESVSGVEDVRCRIRQGRRLVINLCLTARAPVRLREMDSEIKRRVRSSLKTQFGLENVDSINTKITKTIGETTLPVVDEDPPVSDRSGSVYPRGETPEKLILQDDAAPLPPEGDDEAPFRKD